MENLMTDFLTGRLAVLVDKDEPNEIISFYDMIKTYDFSWPTLFGGSLLEYLLCTSSGPYHFVKGSILTGASLSYVEGNQMDICYVKDFLENNTVVVQPLEENEFDLVMFGA